MVKVKYNILICLVTLFFSCSNEDSGLEPIEEIIAPSPILNEKLLICHRGLDGYPENTKVAIEAAIRAGYRAVECDIAITKDGVAVLSHDRTIDRCSNGDGKISEMTYQDLLKYDFGSWKAPRFMGEKIPTLDEILKLTSVH